MTKKIPKIPNLNFSFCRSLKEAIKKLETKTRFCWFSVYSKLLGKDENLDLGFWKLFQSVRKKNFFLLSEALQTECCQI
jgi:hypothetical protein